MPFAQFDAVMIAEGCFDLVSPSVYEDYDSELEAQIAAYQQLIDDGTVWHLQGSFGRTAAHLIDNGLCVPAGRTA